MKYFVKRLQGCTIIYLHNLYQCRKCILLTATHNESCKPGDEFYENGDRDTDGFFKPLTSPPSEKEEMDLDEDLRYSFPTKQKIRRKRNVRNNVDKSVKTLSDYSPYSMKLRKTASKIQKKKSPSKKSNSMTGGKCMNSGNKVAGKGTLKRKKGQVNKLENLNDDYKDDDLFEDKDFGTFQELLGDESDYTDKYDQLKTPIFPLSLTPRETTPSPNSKSFCCPSELDISKIKEAQQCHQRRSKRKIKSVPKKEEVRKSEPQPMESVIKCLEQVADILKVYKTKKGRTSDSDEDPYYSDVLVT